MGGGGGDSRGNCRKGFMSRGGWIIVGGVLRKVGTGPARFRLPKIIRRPLFPCPRVSRLPHSEVVLLIPDSLTQE